MKKLTSVCLISQSVRELCNFYQRVLEVAPAGDDDFAAFSVPGINFPFFRLLAWRKWPPA